VYTSKYTLDKEIIMKTATAKDLRIRTSAILEDVEKGHEVIITKRGKSVAVLMPLNKRSGDLKPTGFGMWKDRKDLDDVSIWIDNLRKERSHGNL